MRCFRQAEIFYEIIDELIAFILLFADFHMQINRIAMNNVQSSLSQIQMTLFFL